MTAMAKAPSTKEEAKTREVRIGLVMYGGVSLAIYINGVSQEFFRAVRGRGVYKLIKALTDSDVIIDIISGTSAGGINGILLGYALCNEKDFTSSSDLWRRNGDIRSLLRSPGQQMTAAQSLLNSEGYYQPRLEDAFRYMPTYVPEAGEINSRFSELDLFITGTDVDGNVSTQFDDAGHSIDVKDHRSVFLLKHRKGRKEPFNPKPAFESDADDNTTYKALAKLARLTSCFPAAFAPVYVSRGGTKEDALLQAWGLLNKESTFLDGGVIDNKPFTYTLQQIFYRAANRDIDRKLIYVEPDPEHWDKRQQATNPNFLQAIIASLIGIPGYESIADDLQMLYRHNSKVKQYKRLVSILEEEELSEAKAQEQSAAEGGEPDKKGAANKISPEMMRLYKQSRLIYLGDRVVRGLFRVDGRDELLDPKLRDAAASLINAFDTLTRNLRGESEQILEEFDVYFRLRRLFRLVYLLKEKLCGKIPPGEKEKVAYSSLWMAVNRFIELLDILRVRLEALLDEAPIDWKNSNDPGLIWSKIRWAMKRLLRPEQEMINYLQNHLGQINDEIKEAFPAGQIPAPELSGWKGQDNLSAFNRKLKSSANEIIKELRAETQTERQTGGPPHPGRPGPVDSSIRNAINRAGDKHKQHDNLLLIIDDEIRTLLEEKLKDTRDDVLKVYDSFEVIDIQVFPIEMIAELHEKDIIEIIRISPRDAEKGFSNKGFSDKVSGDTFYHFGGFFKRSWRSNDILWGRLDGLCQIVETLLTRQRLEDIIGNEDVRNRVRAGFTDDPQGRLDFNFKCDMDPANLFPHAGTITQRRLSDWIRNLLSRKEDDRAAALEEFDSNLELLIEAAQLEALREELQNVITDALEEQAQWNQFLYPPGASEMLSSPDEFDGSQAGDPLLKDSRFAYKPAAGSLDPYVAVVAASGRAQVFLEKFEAENTDSAETPKETALGRYFTKQYRVGAEKIDDVPRIVLLEILAVSLLVLRNCVLGVLGDNAEKIKGSPLYLFGVSYPLRIFYGAVTFIRRAPRSWQSLQLALLVISIATLLVGATWRDPIIYNQQEGFHLKWFLLFIAAPLVILFTQSVYFLRGEVVNRQWWQIFHPVIKTLAVAALVLAPLIVIPALMSTGKIYDTVKAAYQNRLTSIFGPEPAHESSSTAKPPVLIVAEMSPSASPPVHTIAHRKWVQWLAMVLSIASIALSIFGPYVGGYFLHTRRGRKGLPAKDLERTLNSYFTLEEIEMVAKPFMASKRVKAGNELKNNLEEYIDPAALEFNREAYFNFDGTDPLNLKPREMMDLSALLAGYERYQDGIQWYKLYPAIENAISVNYLAEAISRRVNSSAEVAAQDAGDRAGGAENSAPAEQPVDPENISMKEVSKSADKYLDDGEKRLLIRKLIAGHAVSPRELRNVITAQEYEDMRDILDRFAPDEAIPWLRLLKILRFYLKDESVTMIAKRLLESKNIRRSDLQAALQSTLKVNTIMKLIAFKLKIPLAADMNLDVDERKQDLVVRLVKYSKENNELMRLEQQMRFVNPGALYNL